MDRNQEKISVGQSPEGKQEEFGVEQSPGQVMENKHDSFVMYRSFVNVAKQLGGDFCNRFIMCICDYGLDGKEPEEPDLQVFFAIIKPLIDKAHKRHDARRNNGKKGAEYGKLGGAPKGNQNARKNFEQQPQNNPKTTPKQPINVNVNENVNENVNVNENENENGIIDNFLSLSTNSNENSTLLPLYSCYSKLINDYSWVESLCRRFHERGKPVISIEQMKGQIQGFFDLLEIRGVGYKALDDAKSHFVNWMDGKFKRHEGIFCLVGAKDVLPGAENISDQKFEEMDF